MSETMIKEWWRLSVNGQVRYGARAELVAAGVRFVESAPDVVALALRPVRTGDRMASNRVTLEWNGSGWQRVLA